MSRATDPMRMNWLWRLICEVADVQAVEMVEALQDMQVAVDLRRVRSWSVSDRDDSFFPMTIAEVERNMRALVLSRIAMRADRGEPDGNLAGKARGAFGAGNDAPDDERESSGATQRAGQAPVVEEAMGGA